MKTFIIGLALLLIGHKSFCQDWIYIGANTDGDKWYVKSSYVKKEGSAYSGYTIRIWTKNELNKTTIRKGGKLFTYTNVKELRLIVADCTNRKLKFISTTVYNSQGKVIDNWTLQNYEQEWHDVIPESMGEALLDKICELFD